MADKKTAFTNVLSSLATDPVRNFRFLVDFLPNSENGALYNFSKTMGFTSVSGLTISTEAIQYREGGYNTTVHQLPGQTSFSPITLSKGVFQGDSSQLNWMKRLFSITSAGAKGGVGADFRCNLDIRVLSHPNPAGTNGSAANATLSAAGATNSDAPHVALRFKVYNAWITNLSYSNLDAGGNSLMVEEMTLVHEGWDATYASALTAAGSAAEITI
jgi:phage tail-like protein